MDAVSRDIMLVIRWVSQAEQGPGWWIFRKTKPFTELDKCVRHVVAAYRVHESFRWDGFDTFESICDDMLQDAVECLQLIEANRMAAIVESYIKVIESNPYLGPVKNWPTKKAPKDMRSKSEDLRIANLDSEWEAAEHEFGVARFWAELVCYINRIESDTRN